MHAERISAILADQHRRIDHGIATIVDGTGKPQTLAAALELLREHLYVEEETLFPPLVETGLALPVFVMKREHGHMWPLIRSLEAACAAGAGMDDLREDAGRLLQQLNIHDPKEERIVYTAADRYDPAHPDTSLVQAVAAARMPKDWVCAMAAR